jgi:NADH-quinone oxidoreductase subunit E
MDARVSDLYTIIKSEAASKGALIDILEKIQGRYRYLPSEALLLASAWLDIPLSRIYSVATFYNAFSLVPKGKHCISVCMGTACHVRGSPRILDRLKTQLGIEAGETTRNCLFTLETVNCLGACALGPIIVADGEYAGQMTLQRTDRLLKHLKRTDASHG